MRPIKKPKDSEQDKARSRLIAHFEDNPDQVFYSRQLEVMYEREYFHWITNRAIRQLVEEGKIRTESRPLSTGAEIKLLWHRDYRFYKRSADQVVKLVDEYTVSATDGALGMQGEHLTLAAFARQKFTLIGEETKTYGGISWDATQHDLDFIFERDGRAYGVEVKNTLGYLDIEEFLIKIRLARHIGVTPIFAVRALPKTWTQALISSGGFALIMGYQFYPWTHQDLVNRIRERFSLPVDTPKRIEAGTMMRLENWISSQGAARQTDSVKVERLLKRMEQAYVKKPRVMAMPPFDKADFESE